MNIIYRRKLGKTSAISILAFILAWCAGCGTKQSAKEAPSGPPPNVVVADVIERTVPVYGEFVGQTKAHETVELRARVEGMLQAIYFQEGRPVRKGQLLFSLDKAQYLAAVQSAKAVLAKSEADLAQARQRTDVLQAQAQVIDAEAVLSKTNQDLRRIQPLAVEKAVTELELDAAVAADKSAKATVDARKANLTNLEAAVKYTIERAAAEVSSAKAKLIEAQLDVGYCDIYSPITGIIGFKNVDVGNFVGRGEATLLATVSSSDPLLVDFSLSEIDYLNLTDPSTVQNKPTNRRIELLLSDDSMHPYPGALNVIDRKVDPATGTLKVEVTFDNPGNYLRPGQFARIRAIVASIENAILVPQRAIQEMQGAKTVMVVDAQNVVAVRTVTVGEKSDNLMVVLEGLAAGERVIVEGMQKVRPGSEVNPSTGETAAVPGG
jgi:membrane fusion protein, multidrug efflux system